MLSLASALTACRRLLCRLLPAPHSPVSADSSPKPPSSFLPACSPDHPVPEAQLVPGRLGHLAIVRSGAMCRRHGAPPSGAGSLGEKAGWGGPSKPPTNHTPPRDSTEVSTDPLAAHPSSTSIPKSPSLLHVPWSPGPLFIPAESHAWGWLGAMVGNRVEVAQSLTPSFGCK